MRKQNSNSHESFPTAKDLADLIPGDRKGIETHFSGPELAAFEAVSHYNVADQGLGELLVFLVNGPEAPGEIEELAQEAREELEEAVRLLQVIEEES